MANMSIGTLTFTHNPSGLNLPIKRRFVSAVDTFESVAVFSWGASIVGIRLTLTWDFMLTSDFDSLESLFVADTPIVFDPTTGAFTYTVEIMNLSGAIFIDPTASAPYRKDVTLELLVISETAVVP